MNARTYPPRWNVATRDWWLARMTRVAPAEPVAIRRAFTGSRKPKAADK